jgi:AcrR family transcriptional regulator
MKKRTSRKTVIAKKSSQAPPDNRRQALLDAAAKFFSDKGFSGTSIRDIAQAVGMLPGSIYYHFESKSVLALAVHAAGVEHIKAGVDEALRNTSSDPWDRLEAASCGHLQALLDGTPFAQVVTPQFARSLPTNLRPILIRQRDSYEQLIAKLVEDLPLPAAVSRRYFRLALLGSLNWTLTWYHAGGDSPTVIAKRFVALFKLSLDGR